MSTNQKFHFQCKSCSHRIEGFQQWFANSQQCPECGGKWVDVHYHNNIKDILPLLKAEKVDSMWHYFDYLPVYDKKNVITKGEGNIPVVRWDFFERFAKEKYGITCKVYTYLNELSTGTGTFKDTAGALAASVLKENNVEQYSVASTGNTANAFASYLAAAGISISVFMPGDALPANLAEVSSYGQQVFKVKGDYAAAKKVAAEFAKKHNVLISGGNIDPLRVEAKKTWTFEWIRQMDEFPTLYIQAISGGTGPIAIEKALDDLEPLNLVSKRPRYLMVQADKCAPMVHAWQKASANNFPEGWENDYPEYENPQTSVPTLATGKPGMYPIIAPMVRKNGGGFVEVSEDSLPDIARLVAYETTSRPGPAGAVAIGGFLQGLKEGHIYDGDIVLINAGEGVRRAPGFIEEMTYTVQEISHVDECKVPQRKQLAEKLWNKISELY